MVGVSLMISAPPRAGKSVLARLPVSELLPSPTNSPDATRPPPPTDGFSQLALKGQVLAYVAPDHTWGERFPGKQSPTLQLSLFESGVKRARTSVSST